MNYITINGIKTWITVLKDDQILQSNVSRSTYAHWTMTDIDSEFE